MWVRMKTGGISRHCYSTATFTTLAGYHYPPSVPLSLIIAGQMKLLASQLNTKVALIMAHWLLAGSGEVLSSPLAAASYRLISWCLESGVLSVESL